MNDELNKKLSEIMLDWWSFRLEEARDQIRGLSNKELTQFLINQQKLRDGAWSEENILKIQDFVVGALESTPLEDGDLNEENS